MPMSGSGYDGESAAEFVRQSGHTRSDFFIYAMSDSEAEGNLAFREREGYEHDGGASNEYTYNGLLFFWQEK